jgi:hypothetical protein
MLKFIAAMCATAIVLAVLGVWLFWDASPASVAVGIPLYALFCAFVFVVAVVVNLIERCGS